MKKTLPQKETQFSGDSEAIQHLKEAIASGKHWYIALLEAVALWTSPEETYKGRQFRYLIGGEAFDWLLLAERLCQEVDGQVPQQEVADLLFSCKAPLEVPTADFRVLIGSVKYRAYLNYFYGVVVEEALHLAVEEEIQKEQRAQPYHEKGLDPYQRIYGTSQATLLRRFKVEKGYPRKGGVTLSELREFTYWLFKYRLKNCDKARVASDTKKALAKLERQRESQILFEGAPDLSKFKCP